MQINSEIVEEYFKNKSIKGVKNHWIFNSIEPGNNMYEEPNKDSYNRIKEVYDLISKSIENFKPVNLSLWEAFFGEYIFSPENVIAYLIVGAPNPYDAMVRKDKDENVCMIFDLKNISSYSEDINDIEGIVSNLITHELAHIFIRKKYSESSWEKSLEEILKYIVFDEGIAHFLGFNKNVLSVDWYSDEMLLKRKKAYFKLKEEIRNHTKDREKDIILKSKCGSFWDKFGAISGLFGIVDYYYENKKDIKSLKYLYMKGPEYFWKYIMKLNV